MTLSVKRQAGTPVPFHLGPYRAALADASWVPSSLTDIVHLKEQWLHPAEIEVWEALPAPARRHSLLAGRIAAKLAIATLSGQADPRRVHIAPGCFGQPIVCENGSQLIVSITHTDGLVLAVAADARSVVGIDAELIQEKSSRGLCAFLADEAEHWRPWLPNLSDTEMLFTLWSQRESMGKALRIGLTSPKSVYQLQSLEQLDDGGLRASHRNFPQLLTESVRSGSHVVSLTRPLSQEPDRPWSELIRHVLALRTSIH